MKIWHLSLVRCFFAHGFDCFSDFGTRFFNFFLDSGWLNSPIFKETFKSYARDFSAATGGDKGVDKSSLPKAMQVRGDKFGKVGQTKWTHLANEDTSRLATERPQHRKTGKEQSFDKPSARRT